jgi:hypothetical protein
MLASIHIGMAERVIMFVKNTPEAPVDDLLLIEKKYFTGEIILKKDPEGTWGFKFTTVAAINALCRYLNAPQELDILKHGYTLERAQEIIDGVVQLMIEDKTRLLAASRAQAEAWSDSDRQSAQRQPTGLRAKLRHLLR